MHDKILYELDNIHYRDGTGAHSRTISNKNLKEAVA